jgi:hypothetical protein
VNQKVRVFGLSLTPWRFVVVAACFFAFALSAGGAWLPMAKPNSNPLNLLFSAQVVTFVLLIGAALFSYAGALKALPEWKREAVFFNATVLGSYVGHQLLPLFPGWSW